MKICGVEFKEYVCTDCGKVTINHQVSGPRCEGCFEIYQGYNYGYRNLKDGEQVGTEHGRTDR